MTGGGPRSPIPTYCLALAVVRRGERFLLVRERKHGQRWYLPAGRVEPGETFGEAAARETLEETGVPVAVDGILRVEHTPSPLAARMRVLFTARPLSESPPKSEPDDESLGAAWFSLSEIERLPLRGPEVQGLFRYVAAGAPVYPAGLLTFEGAPYEPPLE